METVKFNGSIKQFQPKKLVSGDNSLRLLLEISAPSKETLDGLSKMFLAHSNLTENLIITIEA